MEPPTPNPQVVLPTNLQHSYTKGTHLPHPPLTHREHHTPTYNSYTKETPNPQALTPTNLQLLHINGPPYPTPYLQPTGTMTYKLNTHTLMEPPTSNPLVEYSIHFLFLLYTMYLIIIFQSPE